MSQIIGKINYPAEYVGLAVEYCTLFSAGEENILTFRLINRGSKTVNAYRVEVVCNGEDQKYCIARKNVEINNGGTSEELEVRLSNKAEEGKIVISTVIYDDLSHEEHVSTVPFASFKVISRVADAVLSKARPKPDALAAACESGAGQGAEKESEQISEQAAEQASEADASQQTEEDTKKKRRSSSSLPLVLAILAVASSVLMFGLRSAIITAYQLVPSGLATIYYEVEFMVDDEQYNLQIVEENDKAFLPEDPTKPGYTFVCWTLNGEDINPETVAITDDTIFVARFIQSSREIFKMNGSTFKTTFVAQNAYATIVEGDNEVLVGDLASVDFGKNPKPTDLGSRSFILCLSVQALARGGV